MHDRSAPLEESAARRGRGAAAGLAVPGALRGAHRAAGPRRAAAGLRRDPVEAVGAASSSRTGRSARCASTTRSRCPGPTRGRSSRRSASSSTRSPTASARAIQHRELTQAFGRTADRPCRPRTPRPARTGASSSTCCARPTRTSTTRSRARCSTTCPGAASRRPRSCCSASRAREEDGGAGRREPSDAPQRAQGLRGHQRRDLPDRRRPPERARDRSAASRTGSRRTRPTSWSRAREPATPRCPRSPTRWSATSTRASTTRELSPVDAARPAGVARPAPAHRRPRVHQHLPRATWSSTTSATSSATSSCRPRATGKLGGKSAGLLLARHILRRSPEHRDAAGGVKVPKTWYITSDGLLDFLAYNHLEDVYNRKYHELDQIRQEYPHIVQVFKNSRFPPEIVQGLSTGARRLRRPAAHRAQLEPARGPHRARPSRASTRACSWPTRARKADRLAALLDAIAEVYASIFGPDPIEYRAERGLLDFHEEMGIMIQEVVGARVGRYFLPAFAGVAFSNNEFRWSPRIRREDGLVRLVPGLGTRAVDRLGRRLPGPGRARAARPARQRHARGGRALLAAQGRRHQPGDQRLRDRWTATTLLQRVGGDYPGSTQVVSLYEDDMLRRPSASTCDFDERRPGRHLRGPV